MAPVLVPKTPAQERKSKTASLRSLQRPQAWTTDQTRKVGLHQVTQGPLDPWHLQKGLALSHAQILGCSVLTEGNLASIRFLYGQAKGTEQTERKKIGIQGQNRGIHSIHYASKRKFDSETAWLNGQAVSFYVFNLVAVLSLNQSLYQAKPAMQWNTLFTISWRPTPSKLSW